MALLDGVNAPEIKVYLDVSQRATGAFLLGYSLLGGPDVLGFNSSFVTLLQIPSTDVSSVSIRRGRTREDQSFQAGQLVLTMDNQSGNYDPQKNFIDYQDSNGDSLLCARTGIRVTGTIAGVERDIFTGYIEQIDLVQGVNPSTVITCADALAWLSKTSISYTANYLSQIDSSVVNDVLAQAGWDMNMTNLSDAGTYVLGNGSTAFSMSDTPATICSTVASSTMGRFFVNRSGKPTFQSYSNIYSNPERFTLGDYSVTGFEVEYDDIAVSGGERYIVNSVTATNFGTSITRINSGSVSRFGNVPKTLTTYLEGNTVTATVAQLMADRFALPVYRVDSIGFDGYGITSSNWQSILTAELGDKVRIRRQPVYNSTFTTYICCLESINHDITATSWRISLNLSPSS